MGDPEDAFFAIREIFVHARVVRGQPTHPKTPETPEQLF